MGILVSKILALYFKLQPTCLITYEHLNISKPSILLMKLFFLIFGHRMLNLGKEHTLITKRKIKKTISNDGIGAFGYVEVLRDLTK